MQKANKNDVRKEIADLITRIKEQSDRIGKQREIPQSEVDLILYRIEELHKKTVVWAYLNELPAEVPASNESSQFSVLGSETAVENKSAQVSETKTSIVETPKAVATPVTPEPIKVVVPEKVIDTPDKTENQEPGTENITEKPTIKSNLKDVRTFIGINEKIMYIRQVFKGDDIAYNTAIEKFNNTNSWTEAQSYLSVLTDQYKWGKHDEPVEIFTQTVKRRFS